MDLKYNEDWKRNTFLEYNSELLLVCFQPHTSHIVTLNLNVLDCGMCTCSPGALGFKLEKHKKSSNFHNTLGTTIEIFPEVPVRDFRTMYFFNGRHNASKGYVELI